MTPKQRVQAQQRLEQWRQLSPAQKQKVRTRFERFQALSPGKKQSLHSTYGKFKGLPEETRNKLRQRWQKMTPAQKQQYRGKLDKTPRGKEQLSPGKSDVMGKGSSAGSEHGVGKADSETGVGFAWYERCSERASWRLRLADLNMLDMISR